MSYGGCEAPASRAGREPRSAPAAPGRRPDLGELFRRHGPVYALAHQLGPLERQALHDISVCRTVALGGHLDVCQKCGHQRPAFNSCRNRHCPKCQGLQQAKWVHQRLGRALPVPHFHVVFTMPAELRPVISHNRERLFSLLLESAAKSVVELAQDPKRLGALVGVTAVLHTWTRELLFHPHAHCIVTGGGLGRDGKTWVASGETYLLPVKALGKLFRGKFLDGLAQLYRQGDLVLEGAVAPFADPAAFARLKDALYRKDWNVYTKAPFKKPYALVRYLGLYTHRVGISNHRVLSIDEHEVVFRTRDKKVCRLKPAEFIRRFLLHVLPKRFVKIRHYGLHACGHINGKLEDARAALANLNHAATQDREDNDSDADESLAAFDLAATWLEQLRALTGIDVGRCTICGGPTLPEPLPLIERSARAPPQALY
jgi:hypothetical protein